MPRKSKRAAASKNNRALRGVFDRIGEFGGFDEKYWDPSGGAEESDTSNTPRDRKPVVRLQPSSPSTRARLSAAVTPRTRGKMRARRPRKEWRDLTSEARRQARRAQDAALGQLGPAAILDDAPGTRVAARNSGVYLLVGSPENEFGVFRQGVGDSNMRCVQLADVPGAITAELGSCAWRRANARVARCLSDGTVTVDISGEVVPLDTLETAAANNTINASEKANNETPRRRHRVPLQPEMGFEAFHGTPAAQRRRGEG